MSFGLAQGSLDLTSDATDRLDGRALELGNLERRVEHVLDEGRVLVDLGGDTGQLELLDNLGRLVHAEDGTRGCDPEARVGRVKRVETNEARVGGDQWSVDRRETMHVLGCILEHAVPRSRV